MRAISMKKEYNENKHKNLFTIETITDISFFGIKLKSIKRIFTATSPRQTAVY